MSHNTDLVFPATGAIRKYTVEIAVALLLALAIMGIGAFFLLLKYAAQNGGTSLFPRGAEFDALLSFLIFAPFGIGAIVGMKLIRDSRGERALAASTNENEIILKKESMLVAISLFEGPIRDSLRKSRSSYLTINFSDIEKFSVEPSRGIRRVSPPFYKLKVKHLPFSNGENVFILRKPYFGKETKLVNAIQERLTACVPLLNDSLVG